MTQREQIAKLVDSINADGGTYHKMDLGHGLVVQGAYDMTKYIDYYGIPADLKGRRVLDIGTASGFLAFECARRGGIVTAIDIWDGHLFDALRDALGLSATYIRKSIYDIDAGFGDFDLVVCGSLLPHLPDIVGAVQRIALICRKQAIIATERLNDKFREKYGYCEFVGDKAEAKDGSEYGTFWRVNAKALERMLIYAGFAKVEKIAKFSIYSEPGHETFRVPHLVMHAWR